MRYVLMKVHRYDHMVYVDISEVIEFRDSAIERRQQEIAQQHDVDLVKHVVVLCVRKNNKTAIDKGIVTASPSSLILSGRAVQIQLHQLRSSVLSWRRYSADTAGATFQIPHPCCKPR